VFRTPWSKWAGKTTTIEILEGLLAPSSGEVRIFGHTWNDNPRQLREMDWYLAAKKRACRKN